MTDVYIYTLICPVKNKVMYVGKTEHPETRYNSHITTSRKYPLGKKAIWINSLLSVGLCPQMDIVETCDSATWVERESFWISHYLNQNDELTNSTAPARKGHVSSVRLKRGTKEWRQKNLIDARSSKPLGIHCRLANLQGEYQRDSGKILTLRQISDATNITITFLRLMVNSRVSKKEPIVEKKLLPYLSELIGRQIIADELWYYVTPSPDAAQESNDSTPA